MEGLSGLWTGQTKADLCKHGRPSEVWGSVLSRGGLSGRNSEEGQLAAGAAAAGAGASLFGAAAGLESFAVRLEEVPRASLR